MVILGFLVMIIILAGLLYLYYRELPKPPTPVKPVSTFPQLSIADLHAECLDDPLQCEVDVTKTTVVEDMTMLQYEGIYGFKTNMMERGIEVLGDRTKFDSFVSRIIPELDGEDLPHFTCDDTDESPHCETMTSIHDKTLKISYEALKESMNNCKRRLPGERGRRKNYNSSGIQTGREPTYLLSFRNLMINRFGEPKLDKMITTLDEVEVSEDGVPNMTLHDIKKHTEEYKAFLNVYATGKAGNGQGITKCDYYVEGCTKPENVDVCHDVAISKHTYVIANRPPHPQLSESDIQEFTASESDIATTGDGVAFDVTSQRLTIGSLTDEEKEQIRANYPSVDGLWEGEEE